MTYDILSTFSRYASGLSALVAVAGLFVGLYEYIRQNKFRRFEKFQEMSARFDANPSIQKVCELLLADSPELSSELSALSKQTKEVFICFLEEIAMMKNSGYMNMNICAYTFGHYATLAINRKEFWANLCREDYYYYALFVEFCRECEEHEQSYPTEENRKLRI